MGNRIVLQLLDDGLLVLDEQVVPPEGDSGLVMPKSEYFSSPVFRSSVLWELSITSSRGQVHLGCESYGRYKCELLKLATGGFSFSYSETFRAPVGWLLHLYTERGPTSSLFVVDCGDAVELAWTDDRGAPHRSGVRVDSRLAGTWKATFEAAEVVPIGIASAGVVW